LKNKGYVVANQVGQDDIYEGRDSLYELSEVLMRFCLEVKKYRGEWVELVVDFLKVWYRPGERQEMMERFVDSKLMGYEDLERAFCNSDDLLASIGIQEFEKSLEERNQSKAFQVAEELNAIKVISDLEYKKIADLIKEQQYQQVLMLLKSTGFDKIKNLSPLLMYYNLLAQGMMLQKEEKWEDSITFFDLAIGIKQNEEKAWDPPSQATLMNHDKYKRFSEPNNPIFTLDPDSHTALYNQEISLRKLKKYDDIKGVDKSIVKHEAWYKRGISLFTLGRYEEAIESYNYAIAIKPDYYKTWYDKGIALRKLCKYEEAVKSYEEAIKIKRDLQKAWHNRGNSLVALGKYVDAIESYDHAVEIEHDDHDTWNNRGICLRKLERYEESIQSYDRAIEINFKSHKAWHNKGFSFFKWGKHSEAISCYDQAIVFQSDKYNSWHDKGLVQFSASNYYAALTTWQQTFKHIGNPEVPRYYNVTALIQEFIEELIFRFTQSLVLQILPPLLETYQQASVVTELGAALVNTLNLIVAPAISDHTAAQWLTLWQTSSLGHQPAMELPLRLMATAIEYKKDPSKRQRLWLNLPSEERPILDKALKLLD
jgi:tetratricopeptide (TPR) repeat protein